MARTSPEQDTSLQVSTALHFVPALVAERIARFGCPCLEFRRSNQARTYVGKNPSRTSWRSTTRTRDLGVSRPSQPCRALPLSFWTLVSNCFYILFAFGAGAGACCCWLQHTQTLPEWNQLRLPDGLNLDCRRGENFTVSSLSPKKLPVSSLTSAPSPKKLPVSSLSKKVARGLLHLPVSSERAPRNVPVSQKRVLTQVLRQQRRTSRVQWACKFGFSKCVPNGLRRPTQKLCSRLGYSRTARGRGTCLACAACRVCCVLRVRVSSVSRCGACVESPTFPSSHHIRFLSQQLQSAPLEREFTAVAGH